MRNCGVIGGDLKWTSGSGQWSLRDMYSNKVPGFGCAQPSGVGGLSAAETH
jgi:hypothetical protein